MNLPLDKLNIKVTVPIEVSLSFITLYRTEILQHMKNIINYL